MINIAELRTENQNRLIGTDIVHPRFSWRLISDKPGISQNAYQLIVFEKETSGIKKLIWDSSKVNSSETINILYEGPSLQSRSNYLWQVRVWCSNGEESGWSEEGHWEMGLLNVVDWVAKWIEPNQENVTEEPELTLEDMFINKKKSTQLSQEKRLHPPKLVRKSFEVHNKKMVKARLYITAHGLYHAKINGQKVTAAEFTPDFTSYSNYLQYQTYDILPFLTEGENVLGVILADGWYAGRISIPGGSAQFGNRLGLIAQLEIIYSDQSKQVLATDSSFLSSDSHYVYSDIFIGEKQDKTKEKAGWDRPGYQCLTHEWSSVEVVDYPLDNLRAQYGEFVKPIEILTPIDIWKDEYQAYIIDFGQVIAGRVRLQLQCSKGQLLKIEHCEILNEKGEFFNNIVGRNKEQTDYYVASGEEGGEIFEPAFTFHGFRYVRLSGYHSVLLSKDISAIVLYSDMKPTGHFTTSDSEINQLWKNIQWSQKGNMLSIPTDCPQRERAGWTGDLQVFAPTSAFNMDIQAFLTRWLWNLQLEQTEDGEILNYSPAPKDIWNDLKFTGSISSAGWGDAIIIVPWVLYQRYGDIRILEQCYPAMEKWLDYVQKSAAQNKENREHDYERYLWDTKFHFGDWMIPSFMLGEKPQGPIASAHATKDIMATSFYAYSTGLSDISKILGKQEQEEFYHNLSTKVKDAFVRAYVTDSGMLTADYQGVYTIALAFNLLSGDKKEKAIERLVELIENNDYKIDTGFLSVPYIMDVLCENGFENIAYKLLFQTACPSWLYEVKNGATTIWESWEAIKPDGTVGSFSFNHYAFGCVGDWLVRHIGGLSPLEPGYRKFKVEPHYCERIKNAETQFESVHGEINVHWEVQDEKNMLLQVKVPPNTFAVISLTDVRLDYIPELTKLVIEKGWSDLEILEKDNRVKFTAGSGQIELKWKIREKVIV